MKSTVIEAECSQCATLGLFKLGEFHVDTETQITVNFDVDCFTCDVSNLFEFTLSEIMS